jgi:hypothetical protein
MAKIGKNDGSQKIFGKKLRPISEPNRLERLNRNFEKLRTKLSLKKA